MKVVVYGAAVGGRSGLIRRLREIAQESTLHEDPGAAPEIELRWPREGSPEGAIAARVTLVWDRLHGAAGALAIEELIAREASGETPGATFTRGLAALSAADAVVFVMDNLAHNWRRELRGLDTLRADLRAAGRDPEALPVVFHILHPLEVMPAAEAQVEIISPAAAHAPARRRMGEVAAEEIDKALTWPRSARVDDLLRDGRGAREALDRALDLIEWSRTALGRSAG